MDVKVTLDRRDRSVNRIVVDDHDITNAVSAEDFFIGIVDGAPMVQLKLLPTRIEIAGEVLLHIVDKAADEMFKPEGKES